MLSHRLQFSFSSSVTRRFLLPDTTLLSIPAEWSCGSQVVVMGPDDLFVSVTSCCDKSLPEGDNSHCLHVSLNRPFGSRILTPSGIRMNCQILDFSWPNKTQGLLRANLVNVAPMWPWDLLMESTASVVSHSISIGRLHPQHQPSSLLVDSEFLEEDVKVLKGHPVHRMGLLSLVQDAQRTNDIIRGIVDPRAVDGSA
ncbi:hypothetical protein J4Q44_G00085800 [Coregonus suidteri]|uniref:Uncharacterized protein n=1 Tax=Coregonus suidteri TaxID=861788 RepID=A0AAN8R1L1_9TELE